MRTRRGRIRVVATAIYCGTYFELTRVVKLKLLQQLLKQLNNNELSVYIGRRLWAEVFHVSMSNSGGTVKWAQISEDLVPVNITCIQESPEIVFNISAYNSQVDKILDVRLVQPGKCHSMPVDIN